MFECVNKYTLGGFQEQEMERERGRDRGRGNEIHKYVIPFATVVEIKATIVKQYDDDMFLKNKRK